MSARLFKLIIGSAIRVQDVLGSGLSISSYRDCLYYELKENNLNVKKEIYFPISYKELILEKGYKIDLLVEEKIIVNLKSIESLSDFHYAQTLNQMKHAGFTDGLLINFHTSEVLVKRLTNTSLKDL